MYENNCWAVSTRSEYSTSGGSLVNRAAGYGIPGKEVDGNDLEAVYQAGQEVINYVRSGKGPYLLQCNTYRIEGHYYGDAMVYRSKEEVDEWRKKDPIILVGKLLCERGVISESDCERIEAEVQKEVIDAIAYAEASPEPSIESIFEDVYTEGVA